jgi:hypothetical protein
MNSKILFVSFLTIKAVALFIFYYWYLPLLLDISDITFWRAFAMVILTGIVFVKINIDE